MNCFKLLLALSVALLGFTVSVDATILSIPDEYQTFAAAFDSVSDGDTVLVSPGVYNEHVEWPRYDFTLASLFLTTGDTVYIDSTVISGDGTGRSCVSFRQQMGEGQRLVGFTLRDAVTDYGGGIYITHMRPSIENVKVVNCEATERGGGIDCSVESSAILRNITLLNNRAPNGGGLGLNSCRTTVEGARIAGNYGSRGGGGVYLMRSTLTMSDFEIHGNETDTGDGYGGGIDVYIGTLSLQDGIISGNTTRVGGAIASTEDVTGIYLERVVLVDNYAAMQGSAFHLESAPILSLNHVTIAGNRSPRPEFDVDVTHYTILNSIFWDEAELVMDLNSYEEGVSRLDYCIFRNIAAALRGQGSDPVRQSGHFIESDPLFVDEESSDYHLTDNSPAIDAGDPNGAKDPDSSRADIGALPNILPNWICGRVTAHATGLPIASASIQLGETRETASDAEGHFAFGGVRESPFRLHVLAPGFSNLTSDEYEIRREDSLTIDLALLRPQIILGRDEINYDLRAQCSTYVALRIRNDGEGELSWKTRVDFDDLSWKPAMASREVIDLSALLPSAAITGAILRNDRWFVAGEDREANLTIWVYDAGWNLLGRYPQGERRWPGIRDIEFDGEMLWGADRNSICGYDGAFDLVALYQAPEGLASVRAIAWDEQNGLLWAGVGSRYGALDRNGNMVVAVRTLPNLSITNLCYWVDEPEGYNLITVIDQTAEVYGIRPQTGEIKKFGELEGDTLRLYSSSAICPALDRYGAVPLVTVTSNFFSPGLDVFQLHQAPLWMTLDAEEGILASGENHSIVIRFIALGEGDEDFTGRIWFEQNGLADAAFVEVTLSVEPNSVVDQVLIPTENSLSAFPNPFNDRAIVRFALKEPGKVKLTVWDGVGRNVVRLEEGVYPAGARSTVWNASSVASGVYLVRLETATQALTVKALLVK